MARRAACLTLVTLSCVGAFVAPASRADFPSRTRARAEPLGATAADLLPGLLPGGGDAMAASGNPDVVAGMMRDASPLLNVANAGAGVGVGVAPASDGGVSAAWVLVSAAPPGDAYLATGLFGIAAAVIAVGAGVLVFSAVSGKDGLAAFLSKEKGNNPFYQDTITKLTPKTPGILNKIRLPELDFVEVYNQPPAADELMDEEDSTFEVDGGAQDSNVVATAESLRQRLLEAVQAKDYDLASSLERELASFLRRNDMNFEDDAK